MEKIDIMRAKKVFEFHKTGDPLKSLDLGIEAKLSKYEISEFLNFNIIKDLNEFIQGTSLGKLYVLYHTVYIETTNGDYLHDLLDLTSDLENRLNRSMEFPSGWSYEMVDTPIGCIISIEYVHKDIFIGDMEAALNLEVWNNFKIKRKGDR